MSSELLLKNISLNTGSNNSSSVKFSENKEAPTFSDFISKSNKEPKPQVSEVQSKKESPASGSDFAVSKDASQKDNANDIPSAPAQIDASDAKEQDDNIIVLTTVDNIVIEEPELLFEEADVEANTIVVAVAPQEVPKLDVNITSKDAALVDGEVVSLETDLPVQKLKAEETPLEFQKIANVNLDQLSSEEQIILLQMGKGIAAPKELVSKMQDLLNNVNLEKASSVVVGADVIEQGDILPKQPLANESLAITKEPIVAGGASLIAAANKRRDDVVAEGELVDDVDALPVVLEKSRPVELKILSSIPKGIVKVADKAAVTNSEESFDVESFQDEPMSFDGKLGKISEFAVIDKSGEKINISFDEFAAMNKDVNMAKPQEQITMSLKHAVSEGKSAVSISLYPKALGHIDVKIEFATNSLGQSEVQKVIITADRPSTLKILENTKIQLEASLAELKKEAATTVTETSKKEASLQFDMKNGNNGQQNESYFGSFEERENWMNKFINVNEMSGPNVDKNNDGEVVSGKTHYITSTAVNIEV